MRITPLDIRKQEFRKTMRGLDSDEVYAFLNTVADEYEAVLSDNKNLRERIVELEGKIKEYKNIEENLRNTLLTAERLTAEAKENARREASLIIREAEIEAEKAAGAIRAQASELRKEILELKKHKDNYLTRLRTLIETHQKMIEGFAEDFENVDKEIERANSRIGETAGKRKQAPRMSREKITEDFAHEAKGKVTWEEERKREDEERPTVPRPDWQQKKRSEDSNEKKANAKPASEDQPRKPEQLEEMNQKGPASQQSVGKGSNAAEGIGTEHASAEEVVKVNTEPIGAVYDIKPPETSNDPHAPNASSPLPGNNDKLDRASDNSPYSKKNDSFLGEKKLKEDIAKSIEENLYPDPEVDNLAQGKDGKTAEGSIGSVEPRVDDKVQQVESAANQSDVRNDENIGAQSRADISGHEPSDEWKQYDVRSEETDWKSYEISAHKESSINGQGNGPNYPQELGTAATPGAGSSNSMAKKTRPEAQVAEEGTVSGQASSAPSEQAQPRGSDETGAKTQLQDRPNESEVEEALSGLKEIAEKDESSWSIEELKKNLTNLGRDEGN